MQLKTKPRRKTSKPIPFGKGVSERMTNLLHATNQLKTMIDQLELNFDGPTIEDQDNKRLGKQLAAVHRVMKDGNWRTLGQIAVEAGYLQSASPGISARLRDFRKPKFQEILGNQFDVDRRRIDGGVYEYRLITKAL